MTQQIIMVTVEGKAFETALDYNGVQRFLPHGNVNPVLKAKLADFEALKDQGAVHFPQGIYTLNDAVIDYYDGVFTADDFLMYHTDSGYSVCGLADLSFDFDVDNPLWNER